MPYSFVRTIALEGGGAFVTARDGELYDYAPFSRVYELDDTGWSHRDYDFYIFSASSMSSNVDRGAACGLGLNGEVAFFRNEYPIEQVAPPISSVDPDMRPGRFTYIREIDGVLYAVAKVGATTDEKRLGTGLF
jgi:hypothetical protein